MKFTRREALGLLATSAAAAYLSNFSYAAGMPQDHNRVAHKKTIRECTISSVVSARGDQAPPGEFEKTLKVMHEQVRLNGARFDARPWECFRYDADAKKMVPIPEGIAIYKEYVRACFENGMTPEINVTSGVFVGLPDEIQDTTFGHTKIGWPTTEVTRKLMANLVADFVVELNKEFPGKEFLIQLGDEITNNDQWPQKGKFYADYVKEVRKCLTQKGGKCKLLLGSVSMQEMQQKWIRTKDFFKNFVVENDLDKVVDGYSLHVHNHRPDLEWTPESNFFDTEEVVDIVRTMLKKPLYVTSCGIHSWPRKMENGVVLDEAAARELQANYNVRFLLRALAISTHVDIYGARDLWRDGQAWTNERGPEQEYGLIDHDHNLKPAGKAISEFIETYGNHKLVSYGPLKHNNHHFEAVLQDPNGKKTYLRWCMTTKDIAEGFTMKPTAFDAPYQAPGLLARIGRGLGNILAA